MFRNLIIVFCFFVFVVNAKTVFAEDGFVKAKVITKIVKGQAVSPKKIAVAKVFYKKRPFTCSGVLITRRYVLTASHCVPPGRKINGKSVPYTVMVARKRYVVKNVIDYPRARKDRQNKIYDNDIAILRLKKPVGNINPIPFLLSKPISIGDNISIYGYGEDKWGHSGYLVRGDTAADNIDEHFIEVRYDNNSEAIPCFGDSGGPAIFSYDNGSEVVSGIVGITSWSSTTNCSLGTKTFYVNTQRPEIMKFIKKIAKNAKSK